MKRRKLQDQADALGPRESAIFDGVTVYVNGWTQPTADEIHRLVHTHGGNFIYSDIYSHCKVTHVIATNLPDSKVKSLGDTVVCLPDWIVDSVAAGRRLSLQRYRLYSRARSQRRLQFERNTSVPAVGTDDSLSSTRLREDETFGRGGVDSYVSPEGEEKEEMVVDAGGERERGEEEMVAGEEREGGEEEEKDTKTDTSSVPESPPYSLYGYHTDTAPTLSKPLSPPTIPPPVANEPPSSAFSAEAQLAGGSADVKGTDSALSEAGSSGGASELTSRKTDFVREFYTHSRLHHLSTWSSELKQFARQAAARVSPKYPKLPASESLLAREGHRLVVHVDLDCFFVSVSLRDRLYLRGKPVAVTHAKLPRLNKSEAAPSSMSTSSTARAEARAEVPPGHCVGAEDGGDDSVISESAVGEARNGGGGGGVLPKYMYLLESMSDVASCSYEARQCGVRNGMQVGRAISLCPNLQFVPYEFDKYRAVSQTFYEVLLSYTSAVEAVSCDEAFLELTELVRSSNEAQRIIKEMREEIEAQTGCKVSAGIGPNLLLARMATRRAKPDGQFCLSPEETDTFLSQQPVRDLPGVGYSLSGKLREMEVETCSDLKSFSQSRLQSEFGPKTGLMLFQYARGIDHRSLKLSSPERKSLSVDINYGIRFGSTSDANDFIANLSSELERRAREANVLAGTITLKLKIRQPDVPLETKKYLGHGACDNVSRSTTLLEPVQSSSEIAKVALRLLMQLKPNPADVRGVGIQLQRLVPADGGDGGSPAKTHTCTSVGGDLRTFFGQAGVSAER